MLLIRVTFWDLIIIGIGVGVVLGLIPLILGFVKNKRNLGIYGFIASIVSGSLSSILSFIAVIVFIWLILKKPIVKEPSEIVNVNENPVKVEIDNTENR
jgi:hypothetical protein